MLFNKSSLCVLALATFTAAKTIDVKVGEDGNTFTPDEIKAEVDDEVVFQFESGGHDVSQSSFEKPCQPLEDDPLFSSVLSTGEKFTITVKDEKPIWLYCSQGKHCNKGMTAAINAPSSGKKTLKAYTKAAAKADSNTTPENVNDGGSGNSTSTASGTATSTGSASSTATGGASSSAPADDAASTVFDQNTMALSGVVALFSMGATWFGLL